MTIDEQHKFFLERPTPTTPMEWTGAPGDTYHKIPEPNLGMVKRSEVRWKPESKTVPAWPPVKPYWVRAIERFGSQTIHSVQCYCDDGIKFMDIWKNLNALDNWNWTTDFKTWHPFTKKVEE